MRRGPQPSPPIQPRLSKPGRDARHDPRKRANRILRSIFWDLLALPTKQPCFALPKFPKAFRAVRGGRTELVLAANFMVSLSNGLTPRDFGASPTPPPSQNPAVPDPQKIRLRAGGFRLSQLLPPTESYVSPIRDSLAPPGIPMSAMRFVRLAEVKDRTGLSKTEIYRRMDEGTFPKVIRLGKRSVAWRSDELDAWFAERIASTPGAPVPRRRGRPPLRRASSSPPRAQGP
jgi:prophage regulatory protein